MTERPILFSGAMVRAILDGRKGMTRRVVKPQPYIKDRAILIMEMNGKDYYATGEAAYMPVPYAVGDRLWVRETWGPCAGGAVYRADDHGSTVECPDDGRWRPSIFMPRWASRLTLEVTGVRVERVQEISEEDAVSEGIDRSEHQCGCEVCAQTSIMCPATASGCLLEFRRLWDSLNGPRGYGWSANPWVWVVSFRRVTP